VVIGTRLPADLTAPRQARAAVRQALAAWGLSPLSADAELLASELAANAAEHAGGPGIDLYLREHTAPGGQPAITCEVTDTSPAQPQTQPAAPDAERGRGLAIVTAIAASNGITTRPGGKTAWFTLTARASHGPDRQQPEAEAGA